MTEQQLPTDSFRDAFDVELMYATYIALLRDSVDNTNPTSSKDDNEEKSRVGSRIIQHLSQWQGGRHAPSHDTVRTICTLKQLHYTKKQSKYQLLQKLIPSIITDLVRFRTNNNLKEYVAPYRSTDHAINIFPSITAVVITQPSGFTQKTSTQSKIDAHNIPAVGTKVFKSMSEYRAFVRVGKHFAHASPCVCPSKIVWKEHQLLVYEEWQEYKRCESIIRFTCRRRRQKPKAGAPRLHMPCNRHEIPPTIGKAGKTPQRKSRKKARKTPDKSAKGG